MKRISFVLVIGLGLAASSLALMVKQRLNDRIMISTMANGLNIYRSIAGNESSGNRRFPLPQSTEGVVFKTSTEYFRCMVTSGYMTVEFGFFASPGSTAPHGPAPELFTSDYNIWCVVADISPACAATAPVLFTKNLALTSLEEQPRLTDSPPFGKRGVVVIQKDAAGRFLEEYEIQGYFSALGMKNKVLRP